jgi:CTP:molybdopterin cytidylyltransferase MocA
MYPIVNQQRGNPVMLSEAVAHQVLRGGMDCRDFIHAHPEQVYHFSSESDHFVMDIDEQKDLETFKHRTGVTLVLPTIRDSDPY